MNRKDRRKAGITAMAFTRRNMHGKPFSDDRIERLGRHRLIKEQIKQEGKQDESA